MGFQSTIYKVLSPLTPGLRRVFRPDVLDHDARPSAMDKYGSRNGPETGSGKDGTKGSVST